MRAICALLFVTTASMALAQTPPGAFEALGIELGDTDDPRYEHSNLHALQEILPGAWFYADYATIKTVVAAQGNAPRCVPSALQFESDLTFVRGDPERDSPHTGQFVHVTGRLYNIYHEPEGYLRTFRMDTLDPMDPARLRTFFQRNTLAIITPRSQDLVVVYPIDGSPAQVLIRCASD